MKILIKHKILIICLILFIFFIYLGAMYYITSKEFENNAIQEYLFLNIYAQKDYTFFSSIKQLKPGSYGTYENGKLNIYLYSSNERFKKYNFINFNEEELISILKDSISRHLMGDVSVGLATSSGLDSLTLLGLIKKSDKFDKLVQN